MITRGIIIGKIVDDIASLKYQIEMRNKLNIFDLSKVCEDFCKQVLNILYELDLKNLNNERTNTPGLDLGDTRKEIAYQITSTKYSNKITNTLSSITDDQLNLYKKIFVFILGTKATSYTIDINLLDRCSFEIGRNIIDFNDLLKDIMVAEMDVLDELYSLFKKEFRQIKIELEPIDTAGDYESSLYNSIEKIPNKIPANAKKLSDFIDYQIFNSPTFSYDAILNLYKKLSKIPRVTRELIPIIAERGQNKRFNYFESEFGILPQTLKHILRISQEELDNELVILSDAKLIYIGDDFIPDKDEPVDFIVLYGELLNEIISWSSDNNINIKTLFNTMDWTVFDN